MPLIEKKKCSGCGACKSACPVNAIYMKEDNEGFWYPFIDEEKCIKCNLCEKVCPIGKTNTVKPEFVYAAKNKDVDVRMKSTSGAIFTAIAEYVFSNNGVVFGCEMDEEKKVFTSCAKNLEELVKHRGAKYVQSDGRESFKETKEHLENGRLVLYTGTPCQIAGLKRFLHKDYENLILCDLVCHSVPSQKALKKYIEYLEVKHKESVKKISFRDKTNSSWDKSSITIEFISGAVHSENVYENIYIKGFNKGLFSRPACSECSFKNFANCADITIADYWGIEDVDKTFFDKAGVSLLIVNNKKGRYVFEKIEKKIDYIETSIEEAIVKNPHIEVPMKEHKDRKVFFEKIDDEDFAKLIERLIQE